MFTLIGLKGWSLKSARALCAGVLIGFRVRLRGRGVESKLGHCRGRIKWPLKITPVEKMGPHGEIGRVPVYADNLLIARAAFRAAVEQYPKERIRLRAHALVMEEHKPK